MSLNEPSFLTKTLKTSSIICLLLIGLSTWAWAGEFTAFGPQDIVRERANPVTVTNNFSVLNPNTEFFLRIYNGGIESPMEKRCSSAIISINGIQVVGPETFNQTVKFIEVPVTLQLYNTIEVEVRGKPGGLLTVPYYWYRQCSP